MKRVLQIALGVYLGSVSALITYEIWNKHQEEQAAKEAERKLAESEKKRLEQADRIRALFLESRKTDSQPNTPPRNFVPDDALIKP